MTDPLINLRPITDFEKLIWERAQNKLLLAQLKKLKIEIGMLQCEKEELLYKIEHERQIHQR